jgi:hypothetical protein
MDSQGWIGRRTSSPIPDAALASKLVKNVALPAMNGISDANSLLDGETLTLTNGLSGDALITEVYEADNDATTTPGNIVVDCSEDEPSIALVAAINANSALVRAIRVDGDDTVNVKLFAVAPGTAGNAYTLVVTGATADAATFSGGTEAAVKSTVTIDHTVTALEATEGVIALGLPFDATLVLWAYRTAAGVRVSDLTPDTTAADTPVFAEGVTAWTAGDSLYVYAEGES